MPTWISTCLIMVLTSAVVTAQTYWSDDFESYVPGTLCPQATCANTANPGGWTAWTNLPGAAGVVSTAQARSGAHSLLIAGGVGDAVQAFSLNDPSGYPTSGSWVFTLWQWIDGASFSGNEYVILQSMYNHGGPYGWAIQINFDAGVGTVGDDVHPGAAQPIVMDQWVEIKMEFDLTADTLTLRYNGAVMYQGTYTSSSWGTTALSMASLNLFSGGTSTIYYDDMSLGPPGPSPVTIPIADFGCQAGGTFVPSGAPDCEGWQSLGGHQIIMPNGIAQTCQTPGSGQWCEITPATTGPAFPVAPACSSGPGTCAGVQPPAPGTASEMRLATTAPTVAAGGQIRFHVDWYWFSSELPGSSYFNDYAQVVLIDPGTGNVVETAMRVDTNSNLQPVANTCTSGFSNLVYPQAYDVPQTATVIVPVSLHGNPVEISVLAANQGDGGFDSALWVDDLEWEVFQPGTVPPPVSSIGQACGALSLATTPFTAGSPAVLSATGAPAGAGGLLFAGAHDPAPLSLLPGCEVVVSFAPPPIQIPVQFSLAGAWMLPVSVPSGTAGFQFAMQAVAFDPLIPLGLDLSNGLLVTIDS